MMMDDDMENGGLGSYQDRLRTFPNMRSKPYVPLVSTEGYIFVLLKCWRNFLYCISSLMPTIAMGNMSRISYPLRIAKIITG